jgi:hypothetical protein
MTDDTSSNSDSVAVSMEISGPYSEVVSKLRTDGQQPAVLSPFVSDLETILDTLSQLGGGTRSAIAERLSGETTREYDPEAVVETMQVLERYDLVELEGNTWKPGPELRE